MKKMKNIRNRHHERGVALMFSLGILGLMAVLAMTFASVSMTNQETTENSVSEYSARSLADAALNRSVYTLNNSISSSTNYKPVLASPVQADALVSGGDAANITASQTNPNRQDFDYLWKLVPELPSATAKRQIATGLDTGYHTDFINSMRFRVVEGFGQRPENCKSANAGVSTSTFNESTTPFWQYVRDPVNNSIIGRFAYLTYRPHGLLDLNAFSTSSTPSMRRLGLTPAEMDMSDLDVSPVNTQNVYGRWRTLATRFGSARTFTTASDGLRQILNSASSSETTLSSLMSTTGTNTPGTLYPAEEIALNNLFGKWFRTAKKPTPDFFWYKRSSSAEPLPYLRFNLNRSLADWNALTVSKLTDTGNLHSITDFSRFQLASGAANAIPANATTCIPWFINSDAQKQNQLAANFLAWFQSTPANDTEVINRGLWGKTDSSSTSAILDDPDWTANMRTPYIREVAVEMDVAFTLAATVGTFGPPEDSVNYISKVTLNMTVESRVYVSLIDFFNTGMTNLSVRLPGLSGATAPQVSILLPTTAAWNFTGQGETTYPISVSTGTNARPPDATSHQYYVLGAYGLSSNGTTTVQTAFDSGKTVLNDGLADHEVPFSIARCGFTASSVPLNSTTSLPVAEMTFSPTTKEDAQNLKSLTFSLTQAQIKELKCRLQDMGVALFSSSGIPYDYSRVQVRWTNENPVSVDLIPAQDPSFSLTVTAGALPIAVPDSKICHFVTGFHCRDVRSNLNAQETRDGSNAEDNWRNWGSEITESPSISGPNHENVTFFVQGSTGEINYLDRMRLASEVKHKATDGSVTAYNQFVKGTSTDDSTLDHTLPTFSTRMRPELPPYSSYSSANNNLYPVPHPWETGMINRGEAFRTINLTKFNSGSSCNGIQTSAPYIQYGQSGFGSYTDGDANILDQLMVTSEVKNGSSATLDLQDSVGKVDINSISFAGDPDPADLSSVANATVHQARYAYPNRGNLYAARLLFGHNLRLINTPVNTYFDQGTDKSMLKSANLPYLDGLKSDATYSGTQVPESSIKSILEGVAGYNQLIGELNYIFTSETDKSNAVRRYKFHSRAELLRENVDTSVINNMPAVSKTLKTAKNEPLETAMNTQLANIRNAFIQSTATLPDTVREELFCKTVMLLHAGDAASSQPDDELVVFGIAQTIKDTAGTLSTLDLAGDGTFAASLAASSAAPGSAYRTYAGSPVPVSGLELYKSFYSYPQLSFSTNSITASASTLSSGTNGTGIYRVGFDKVLSTQRVIGWLKKDYATGKWNLVRVQYVD